MKKIFLTIACICLFMSSCSDFLEETPKSILTLNDYYQTAPQATSNVNTLYRNGAMSLIGDAWSAYIGPFATINGMLTGYYRNSYEGQENVCQYARELTRQQWTNNVSGTMDGVWDECYNAINITNAAIKFIPGIKMDESNKNRLIAEARFFRGFNFFFLVKTFGDVPLPVEPYTTPHKMDLERTPAAAVYELIEKDLTDAVAALPATDFKANNHRITKYIAEQALVAVYMQQGKYDKAAPLAQDIIKSGKFELTQNDDKELGSAFNKLRTTDDLPEVIYAYEFDSNINRSNWWPTYAFTSGAVNVFNKYSIFERVYGPNKRFLNVYTDNDLRAREKQFFATEYTNKTTGKTWTMPDEDNYGCWYYFDQNAMEVSGRGTKDWNIYRYAETLLDAAECIAQTHGVTKDAANYLAQVQARSDMKDRSVQTIAGELMKLSKDKFIETCWTERLREFPLEFKIWDDCLRTGKFPDISKDTKGKVTYVNLIGATNGSGAVFKKSDLLWPVSLNEIQRNPKLTQNEGYAQKQ